MVFTRRFGGGGVYVGMCFSTGKDAKEEKALRPTIVSGALFFLDISKWGCLLWTVIPQEKKQMDPKIDGLEQGKFLQLIYK